MELLGRGGEPPGLRAARSVLAAIGRSGSTPSLARPLCRNSAEPGAVWADRIFVAVAAWAASWGSMEREMRMRGMLSAVLLVASGALAASTASAQDEKPNILVIFGDDIGIANVSAYSDGVMGYTTPNIDRIGEEGVRFLHYYGEQSCTAGRAAFLTGQHGIRTGLTKVGFPGRRWG